MIRYLGQLHASTVHQQSDAEERRIMTEAYLGFTKIGGLDPKTDRPVFLASVFRPSSSGLIKEETPADIRVDALLQLIRATQQTREK